MKYDLYFLINIPYDIKFNIVMLCYQYCFFLMLTILGKPEQLKHGDLRLRLLCLFLCAHLVNVILVSFHGFKAFMLYKLTSDMNALNYAYVIC